MKKTIFLFLISLVAFSFNSCSSDDEGDNNNPNTGIVIVEVLATEQIEGATKFLPGTMYFFKVSDKPVDGIYSKETHTYTINGKELTSSQKVVIGDIGNKQSYLDSKTKYIYVYEPNKYPDKYKESYIETDTENFVINFKW